MVGARQQSKKGMRPGQKSRDQQPSEITKSFKQIKTHRQHKSPQTFWKLYGAAAASEPEPPRPPPAAPERAGPRRSPGQRPGPARPAEPAAPGPARTHSPSPGTVPGRARAGRSPAPATRTRSRAAVAEHRLIRVGPSGGRAAPRTPAAASCPAPPPPPPAPWSRSWPLPRWPPPASVAMGARGGAGGLLPGNAAPEAQQGPPRSRPDG